MYRIIRNDQNLNSNNLIVKGGKKFEQTEGQYSDARSKNLDSTRAFQKVTHILAWIVDL